MREHEPGREEPQRLRVAAIVLNYGTPELTLGCAETVAPQLDPSRDAALLVDNASPDRSGEILEKAVARHGWPHVRVLRNPANRGFAAGNNAGLRALDADWYLLLNSDTQLLPGAVEALLAGAERQPRAGLLGPRLVWPDGTAQISCFRFHSPWSELISGSATGPIRRLLARWDVPLPVDSEIAPDWTSFAAVLIRRDVVETVGPLDEGYFMYFEDSDYCLSARKAGWSVGHVPEARVVHLRGGTSPVKKLTAAGARRPAYYYASRARFFRKAYGRVGLLAANLLWTLGHALARLRERFGRKQPHAVKSELVDIWSAS